MRNISYSYSANWPGPRPILVVFSLGCLMVGALTAVRLLYEGLFPLALWLGSPVAAVLLAAVFTMTTALLFHRFVGSQAATALTPLLFNLNYLFEQNVDLTAGRFVFAASLWLAGLFLARSQGILKRWRPLPFIFIVSFLLPVFLLTLGKTVGTADTFEFQVVIPELGIVHPTGYPLYLLLTKLFTFIPLNAAAWRINLGTAVYGIAAACLLFQFLNSLTAQRVVPVLAAVLFGLSPTFWSQSIQAEVYSLHALIVAAVLAAGQRLAGWRLEPGPQEPGMNGKFRGINKNALLAFLIGLGLTNHLTTAVLLPAVLVLVVTRSGFRRQWQRPDRLFGNGRKYFYSRIREALILLGAFLLPLTLYLYLPLRWQAVNGEPMGFGRFIDWVVGGRFQGALNLTAWWSDPARLGVVGRLLTAEWGWGHLLIGLIGLIVLIKRRWSAALFLGLVWLGFVYYALSYYVPDLSVFLIPAHLVIAALWGVGVSAAVRLLITNERFGALLHYPLLSLLMFFVCQQAVITWTQVDASKSDGGTTWGRAVLLQELDPEGAILADSSKFPPLYYLQQAEGLRPDMDIMVLPDEAAYRAELDARLAAGQTVYLARFLPELAGVYHLRSVGPLTEVAVRPLTTLPGTAEATPVELTFGPISLTGYRLETESPYETGQSAVTFYWRTAEVIEPAWQVYIRWAGEGYQGQATGQFAANNYYPTNAWQAEEIVVDFHMLPRPTLNQARELALQAALAPAFTATDELNWQTVTTVLWQPVVELADDEPRLLQVGPLLIDGIALPEQSRPQSDLVVQLHGFGPDPGSMVLRLHPVEKYHAATSEAEPAAPQPESAFTWSVNVSTWVEPGTYLLVAEYPGEAAVCSWLAAETTACVLGEIEVGGAPLPAGAVNFEDKIALLAVEVPERTLQPGGQLTVELDWLGLSEMVEDYTIFVQVLDEQERIVGQVDSWPLQGTYPTSQWSPGEIVADTFVVPLSAELQPGEYRLHVGWYLLGTLRRLPVLDELGSAVDDKVVVPLGNHP